jgi:KDO2-lipid IV(A) lauroyltransferase
MLLVPLLKMIAKLPFSALYKLSDILAVVLFWTYRRKVVWENITRAFPELSIKEKKRICKDYYRNLTDVFLETLKSLTMDEAQLDQRVKFLNVNILKSYAERRESIFVFSSHQCNWEWMALASSFKFPMPVDLIYKPLKNERFDELMKQIRCKFGAGLIEKDVAMMQLMRKRDKARVIGILADQLPLQSTNKFWTTFLGQDTAFYMGPEQLPKYTKYPVFFSHIWRTSRGHYNVELVPIAKPPYAHGSIDILPRYIEEAEILIRKYPSDWLWSHKRWKYNKPKVEDTNEDQ